MTSTLPAMPARTARISILVAVRNGAPFLVDALESIYRQTLPDFELVVVDDGSDDATPELLRLQSDPRLRVVRSEQRLGIAGALNLGLDAVGGAIVARMDADDLAEPDWLARLVARLDAHPRVGIAGAGLIEMPGPGKRGVVHLMPSGVALTRWRALFGTPFFHNAVAFERGVLNAHGLRYDPALDGAEDFDLWARLLRHTNGDNVPRALVRYRTHTGQATWVDGERHATLRREIALREIRSVLPSLGEEGADLAWRAADARPVPAERAAEAVEALAELLAAFERDVTGWPDRAVRADAARAVARLAVRHRSPALALRSAGIDPLLPLAVAHRRLLRGREAARVGRPFSPVTEAAVTATDDLEIGARPVRVTVVSPEPTPYRAPLFDLVAARPELELTVLYAAPTVAGRTWEVELDHPARTLEGRRVPGVSRLLRHDYPVSRGVGEILAETAPDVVVATGWSTFASQAALGWCRRRAVPYVLLVESHDRGPRSGWRRAVKGAVVPRIVRGAAGVLVVGSLARESMIARGADPARVRVFANTVDVEGFGRRADELAGGRVALRQELGLSPDEVAVLSVARLAPEKGLDTLVEAAAVSGREQVVLVVAGDGPERGRLEALAAARGVRLILLGDVVWERIVELYVAADAFVLLSRSETWGVVVNEAAACGLPLLLSDRVGAAHDLLADGENGILVPADDPTAAGVALRRLTDDRAWRADAGAASRSRAAAWGYEPSVAAFVETALEAAAR